ncbi:MAG: protein TolR [Gammaproteobacteria bacterium]|nr:protein TolR [Gammaproteobacteria bacterium]
MMSQINVVPYIDVTLVLLIIFMITAPLLTRGVQVELPRASAKPLENRQQQQPLVLTVDAQGNLYMSVGEHPDQAVEPSMVVAMTRIVLQRSPKTRVLVKADGKASYADVVRGMVLLQSAGAKAVGLVTKTPDKPLVQQPPAP